MITKDEEDWIGQCLTSVKDVICEAIVVDTGSKDRTVEIAKAHGAQVLFRAWDDDFSSPRNLSIEHAKGDWILILDADEMIAPSNLQELRNLTKDPSICWEFLQRHYSNDHRLSDFQAVRKEFPELERHYGGYFESNLVRMFPNHRGIHYRGRVHELAEHSIREIAGLRVQRTSIRIHHYGHTPEVRAKKNKGNLYTPLGKAKLQDNPQNWQSYFEMGVELNVNGKLEESVKAFYKALEMHPTYLPSLVNIGYVLCELGRYPEAVEQLSRALKLKPDLDEAWCNLGVVYLRSGQFPKAEQCFRRAVQVNPGYVNSWCNLGKSLAFQKRFSEAIFIYRKTIEILPGCATALFDLGSIYLGAGFIYEAEPALKTFIEIEPNSSRGYFQLAQVYKGQRKVPEARLAFEQFISLEEKSPSPLNAEQQNLIAHARAELAQIKNMLGQ